MIPKELKNVKPLTGDERLGAHRESEYLGAEDITPGTEPVLTIKAIYNAEITLARGKERHDLIVFEEESVPGSIYQVRPLVVNSTNRKTLRSLYKAVTADVLVGKKVRLFLQHDVRDPSTGDKVDGIRIKKEIPTGAKPKPATKCSDCGKPIINFGKFTPEQIIDNSMKKYGRALCPECSQKAAEAAKAEAEKAQESESVEEDLASILSEEATKEEK